MTLPSWLQLVVTALMKALAPFMNRLLHCLETLCAEEEGWWLAPRGNPTDLWIDLKPATRKQYRSALQAFDKWKRDNRVVTQNKRQLDRAMYRYMQTLTRRQAGTLFSAMIKTYPGVRNRLPWAYARLKTVGMANRVQHHAPMPWEVAVAIAWWCCRRN